MAGPERGLAVRQTTEAGWSSRGPTGGWTELGRGEISHCRKIQLFLKISAILAPQVSVVRKGSLKEYLSGKPLELAPVCESPSWRLKQGCEDPSFTARYPAAHNKQGSFFI